MRTLQLSNLNKRHHGVSQGIAAAYKEAAEVCLGRHHGPPKTFKLTYNGSSMEAEAHWVSPSARLQAAWGNQIDTTEAGAYCIALAAIEITCGLYAVSRAETKSGADYYLAPTGSAPTDLESLIRLEVSGIDAGDSKTVATRLAQKIKQLQSGTSNTPGIASIVGFNQLVVQSANIP